MPTRRNILGGIVSVGTVAFGSGCIGQLEEEAESSDGNDPNPATPSDSGSSSDGSRSTREQVLSTTRSISEDRYLNWSWDQNQNFTLDYSYTVRSGPDIDVFVTDRSEFRRFENQEGFRVYSSNSGRSGSDSLNLGPGTYYLVLDNTDAGTVAPPTNLDDDIANVEVEAYMER